MPIDRAVVEKIAELARLELGADELESLTRDCQAILEFFEAIRGVDLEAAAAAALPERAAVSRADRLDADQLDQPPAKGAPDWREGFFVLPRLPALDAGNDDGGS